jgi:hypothetical protein
VTDELVSRDGTCRLIHILRRLEGEENINIRTVGGFQFELGRLVRVDDRLAVGTNAEVDLPGGDEIDVSNITINLCAVTSVGEDHCSMK